MALWAIRGETEPRLARSGRVCFGWARRRQFGASGGGQRSRSDSRGGSRCRAGERVCLSGRYASVPRGTLAMPLWCRPG
jgi:hypothetical protein